MYRLSINTQRKRQIVDITGQVETLLRQHYRAADGVCHLVVLHTTAALTTADLDPGTDLDMLDAFERMVPKLDYRHPHDPSHVPDHILSAVYWNLSVTIRRARLAPVRNVAASHPRRAGWAADPRDCVRICGDHVVRKV